MNVTDLEPAALAVRESAYAWQAAGFSVVPAQEDGTKKPHGTWKRYQHEAATEQQIDDWFGAGNRRGLGLICGAISGGLEMFELEGRAVADGARDRLVPALKGAGVFELWQRLIKGYCEFTPSGGIHLLYKISDHDVPKNTKIARRPKRKEEYTDEDWETLKKKPQFVPVAVLAETRGEAGFVVVAPSHGPVHPSGEPWCFTKDAKPGVVPTITWEERQALFAVARIVLDEMPESTPPPRRPLPPVGQTGTRPGDAWAAVTGWEDILDPEGWIYVYRQGNQDFWRRPGKNIGISARTGGSHDSMWVWSTSTELPAEESLTKFRVYSLIHFAGDDKRAAADLRSRGFGDQPTPSHLVPSMINDDPYTWSDQEGRGRDEVVAGPSPSWQPIDLTAILDGTYQVPVPTMMARIDGACLLYPGLIHSFHGESESGKSLVVQYECVRQINAGNDVLYVDFESDAPSIVGRLLEMGADRELLAKHFRYVHPEADVMAEWEHYAWNQLLAQPYTLAVIDGVTDALGVAGASSTDNDDIAKWSRQVPRTIAKKTGAAVVLIDHVTKDSDTRGRFAIGGQAKMAGLDGAAYVVEVIEPLGRGLRGTVVLRVAKDRPGGVRPKCGSFRKGDRTQEAARIVVDSTSGAGIEFEIHAPSTNPVVEQSQEARETFRPTGLMEKVSKFLEREGGYQSGNKVRSGVSGKGEMVDRALDTLVTECYVERSEGGRGAKLHRLIKPYLQTQDPASDRYQPPLDWTPS
jgi:hypothetical protein